VKARAPASTSNIGPGYDVLGLALRLYVEVEVSPAPHLDIVAEGEGADLPLDGSHLAAAVVRSVLGHDHVRVVVRSSIPVGRGLGSSAALAVAAAAAAGSDDPMGVATRFDGHAENAAASCLGGLVAAAVVDGVPVARRLPLDEGLGFVVLVPDRQLMTKQARAALPGTVPLDHAVHNLGRMGLLIAGLGDRRGLTGAAGEDLLHQPARAGLFPEAPALLDALRRAGATVSCWSGAGPSMLAICDGADVTSRVAREGERALADLGLPGRALILDADLDGLVASD
jgi:homoserine kinase